VPRKDDSLNDYLEVLDEKFLVATSRSKTELEAMPRFWDSLTSDESQWIDGEIAKCITDRRYFIENYYVIRDERGRMRTLSPFWDHQEIVWEVAQIEWDTKGCIRLIILKPRQAGSTTWEGAFIFHATIFVPNSYSLVMAQDDRVSDEIYQRMMDAYHALPPFLKPEYLSKQQGRQVIFQRSDENLRTVDPGLGSTLHISNAQKSTGVAIGRTVRNFLGSEVSRWPDAQVWTADIKPSLNAPDMVGFIESTAFGRSGLFYNLWRAAEAGKSIWRALFIPVYKVRKYSLPVYKSENFALTPDEKVLRHNVKAKDNFTIPLGFFKWRRNEIVETINATGSDESHYESYPVTPGEAFISSGFCAFPRKCLNEQEQKHCRDPILIGEIEYNGPDNPPILKLHKPVPDELLDKPKYFNRLWVWEIPDDNEAVEYYLGSDVSSGDGRDYSDAVIYRIGYGMEPTVMVAEWHGLINASHFAKVVAALGHWYHNCEIAVEYQAAGVTTGDELRWVIDYPNIYRWKHMDKVSGIATQHIHWLTNTRTREDMINRMGEAMLDKTIEIRNRHTINEMRDFGRYEGEIKAAGIDNNDDMVCANCIAICALHQSGKRQEWAESSGIAGEGAKHAHLLPKAPAIYAVFNQFGVQVEQCASEAAGWKRIDDIGKQHGIPNLHNQWKVVPLAVGKWNTIWSPAWDSTGAEHELQSVHGLSSRDQMANPDAVNRMRQLIHMRAKFGDERSMMGSDTDTDTATDYSEIGVGDDD
jgi:hypothetical protein